MLALARLAGGALASCEPAEGAVMVLGEWVGVKDRTPWTAAYTSAPSQHMPEVWTSMFRWGLYDAFMPLNYDRSIAEALAALAPAPSHHVLDAGCGTGRLLLHARRWLSDGGRLVGVDVDASGLAYAAGRARRLGVAGRVRLLRGDVRRLALAPSTVDGIIAHCSVYTLSSDADRRAAIVQLAAALRPGGRCVVVVPSERYRVATLIADARRAEQERRDLPRWRREARRHVLYRFTEPGMRPLERALDAGVFHRYDAAELRDHLESAGFRDVHLDVTYGGCAYRATGRRPD
jgi:SAM-dependent methyltransferase